MKKRQFRFKRRPRTEALPMPAPEDFLLWVKENTDYVWELKGEDGVLAIYTQWRDASWQDSSGQPIHNWRLMLLNFDKHLRQCKYSH